MEAYLKGKKPKLWLLVCLHCVSCASCLPLYMRQRAFNNPSIAFLMNSSLSELSSYVQRPDALSPVMQDKADADLAKERAEGQAKVQSVEARLKSLEEQNRLLHTQLAGSAEDVDGRQGGAPAAQACVAPSAAQPAMACTTDMPIAWECCDKRAHHFMRTWQCAHQ